MIARDAAPPPAGARFSETRSALTKPPYGSGAHPGVAVRRELNFMGSLPWTAAASAGIGVSIYPHGGLAIGRAFGAYTAELTGQLKSERRDAIDTTAEHAIARGAQRVGVAGGAS